jgi:hypothetical protein
MKKRDVPLKPKFHEFQKVVFSIFLEKCLEDKPMTKKVRVFIDREIERFADDVQNLNPDFIAKASWVRYKNSLKKQF